MSEHRVFDHPNMSNFECPVCKSKKDMPVLLIAIPGTDSDGICEAVQIHKECYDLVVKMNALD